MQWKNRTNIRLIFQGKRRACQARLIGIVRNVSVEDGSGGAVGGNRQPDAGEEGSIDRGWLGLDRPLARLSGLPGCLEMKKRT